MFLLSLLLALNRPSLNETITAAQKQNPTKCEYVGELIRVYIESTNCTGGEFIEL